MAICKSCGARITWLETAGGKRIPIDEDPVENGNIVTDVVEGRLVASVFRTPELAAGFAPDEPRYVSHFVTCPQAGAWRKTRKEADRA